MQGLRGAVRSGIQVIPAAAMRPLPPINEAPLRSISTLVRDADADLAPIVEALDGRKFDVFISHASEDKDEVVRPLAYALQASGLGVWYDEFELRIGDSLRRKIDRGLVSSRFGVVVLSKAFFGRGWPEYELDGLVTRRVGRASAAARLAQRQQRRGHRLLAFAGGPSSPATPQPTQWRRSPT
jgi:hypothetical protein